MTYLEFMHHGEICSCGMCIHCDESPYKDPCVTCLKSLDASFERRTAPFYKEDSYRAAKMRPDLVAWRNHVDGTWRNVFADVVASAIKSGDVPFETGQFEEVRAAYKDVFWKDLNRAINQKGAAAMQTRIVITLEDRKLTIQEDGSDAASYFPINDSSYEAMAYDIGCAVTDYLNGIG